MKNYDAGRPPVSWDVSPIGKWTHIYDNGNNPQKMKPVQMKMYLPTMAVSVLLSIVDMKDWETM